METYCHLLLLYANYQNRNTLMVSGNGRFITLILCWTLFINTVFLKLDLFPLSHVKSKTEDQGHRILCPLHLTSEMDSVSKKLHITNTSYTKDNVQHNNYTLERKSKYINAKVTTVSS